MLVIDFVNIKWKCSGVFFYYFHWLQNLQSLLSWSLIYMWSRWINESDFRAELCWSRWTEWLRPKWTEVLHQQCLTFFSLLQAKSRIHEDNKTSYLAFYKCCFFTQQFFNHYHEHKSDLNIKLKIKSLTWLFKGDYKVKAE